MRFPRLAFADIYAFAMALLGVVTGLYLLAIGFALHTPRMRRQIAPTALAKLRLWGKVAGVASLLLALFYLYAALQSS